MTSASGAILVRSARASSAAGNTKNFARRTARQRQSQRLLSIFNGFLLFSNGNGKENDYGPNETTGHFYLA